MKHTRTSSEVGSLKVLVMEDILGRCSVEELLDFQHICHQLLETRQRSILAFTKTLAPFVAHVHLPLVVDDGMQPQIVYIVVIPPAIAYQQTLPLRRVTPEELKESSWWINHHVTSEVHHQVVEFIENLKP